MKQQVLRRFNNSSFGVKFGAVAHDGRSSGLKGWRYHNESLIAIYNAVSGVFIIGRWEGGVEVGRLSMGVVIVRKR